MQPWTCEAAWLFNVFVVHLSVDYLETILYYGLAESVSFNTVTRPLRTGEP